MNIVDEMIKLNADGVVFHPVGAMGLDIFARAHCEYTLEEMKSVKAIPKSCRTYYRIIDGKKEIIGRKVVNMSSIREDLLKDYLADKINRCNKLYSILYCGNSAYSKEEIELRLKQIREYEFLTQMFRDLNVFDWDNYKDRNCFAEDIKIRYALVPKFTHNMEYRQELKTLYETLKERQSLGGDEEETYGTGYRNGHINGQMELLERILDIDTGGRTVKNTETSR